MDIALWMGRVADCARGGTWAGDGHKLRGGNMFADIGRWMRRSFIFGWWTRLTDVASMVGFFILGRGQIYVCNTLYIQ